MIGSNYYTNVTISLKDDQPVGEDGEKKFDGSGYDKDLVEHLERDIVQRNPNVHW